MASAQVLPNSVSSSRKQGHLEAGKRRLEEFRKKKAEGRAKKTASAGQLQSTDVFYDKSPPESDLKRLHDSDGASTCEIDSLAGDKLSLVPPFDHSKATDLASTTGPVFPSVTDNSVSAINDNSFSADLVQQPSKDDESDAGVSGYPGPPSVNHDYFEEKKNDHIFNFTGPQGLNFYGRTDHSTDVNNQVDVTKVDGSNYQYSNHHSFGGGLLQNKENNFEDSSNKDSFSSLASFSSTPVKTGFGVTRVSPSSDLIAARSDATHSNDKLKESVPGIGQYMRAGVDSNGPTTYYTEQRKLNSFTDHEPGINGLSWKPSQTYPTDDSDYKASSNDFPIYSASANPEPGSRKLRPSFLDSLNLSRVSSVPQPSFSLSEKPGTFLSTNSEVQNMADLSYSNQSFIESNKLSTSTFSNTYGESLNPPASVGDDRRFLNWSVKDNSLERKQDEDFAALEQHIEDLTQEKFSLQRALDASRTLAESLAAENSSLTESYNQQGTVVTQLKFDMERLQQEIKAQQMEIESIKMEYANAQLECSAADERAKILAAEVIGLEEKALKIRSSELKLERDLENTNAEITSFKKKVLTLEKERQDLQLTINALQEEKKLMQVKLRKASSSGKSIDLAKIPSVMVEVSTSTEDLGAEDSNGAHEESSNSGAQSMPNMQDLSSISLFPGNSQSHLLDVSVAIPPDQLRTIDNINSLISELAIEKDELTRSLASESSDRLKFQELNKELLRKLEVQTQRLELLTAQSMANGITPAMAMDSQPVNDSVAYTDEGDEVVERVLGWIMKLFPGGPSKRRTSKLL